jgi:DNA-directed RNA polymerase subunit RPC12/RpoP
MTEERRRPILKLKNPPPPKPAPAVASKWKCKPCGALVTVTGEEAADDVVRCPACNAKLGVAGDFSSDPPELSRLRARPVV